MKNIFIARINMKKIAKKLFKPLAFLIVFIMLFNSLYLTIFASNVVTEVVYPQNSYDYFCRVELTSIESGGVTKSYADYINDGGVAIYPNEKTFLNYKIVVGNQIYTTPPVIDEIICYYNYDFNFINNNSLYTIIIDDVPVYIEGKKYKKLIIKNICLPDEGNSIGRAEFAISFETPAGYTEVFSDFYCEIYSVNNMYTDIDSIPGNALINGSFDTSEDDSDAFRNVNNLKVFPYGLKYEVNNTSVKITDYIVNDNEDVLYIPSEIEGFPVTDIADKTFSDRTTSFNTVFIPSSVKNILPHAFNSTEGMQEIIISEGLSWIGSLAFFNCENLRYINLPSSVSTIQPFSTSSSDKTFNYYGAFLSYGLYLYQEVPNPSIYYISVIKDSYAESYLRNITYDDVPTFSDLIENGEKIYTVNYDHNGGNCSIVETRPIKNGEKVDLSLQASKQGCEFIGWNTDPNATEGLTRLVAGDKDVTLYAIYSKEAVSLEINNDEIKTEYYIGDLLDINDLYLTIKYSDGSTETISSGYKVSGFSSSVAGTRVVTVTYGDLTSSFIVTINAPNLSISPSSKTLNTGETATVTVTTAPSDQTVTWFSSNTSVATVSGGTITAKGAGTATITAKFTYNGITYSKTCIIIVEDEQVDNEPIPISLAVISNPTKTTYMIGENLNTSGLQLKLTYSDGTYEIITSEYTVSGFDSSTAGTKTVTVNYGALSTKFIVTVNSAEVDGPCVSVESKKASVASTVLITVCLNENPGIWGMDLVVNYDKTQLTLTNVINGTVFSDSEWTPGNLSGNKYILSYEASGFDDITANGILATLEFTINETATADSFTSISLSYNVGDVINVNFDDINLAVVSGGIHITDFVYGDLNGDGLVNKKDSLFMKMYLADNATVIDMQAADVYADGSINKKDSLYLKQYLAGLDVELGV